MSWAGVACVAACVAVVSQWSVVSGAVIEPLAPTPRPDAQTTVPTTIPIDGSALYSVIAGGLVANGDGQIVPDELTPEEPIFELDDGIVDDIIDDITDDDVVDHIEDFAETDDSLNDDVGDDEFVSDEEDAGYDSDAFEDEDLSNIIIDGIHLAELTPEEIALLLEDVDSEFVTELDKDMLRDLAAYRKAWSEIDAMAPPSGVTAPTFGVAPLRKKRALPVVVGLLGRAAFGAARGLFRGAARGGLSRSGTRLTQQYTKSGGLNAAMRDFNRFGIKNTKSFGGKVSGRTGTVGKHRVTVRDGSSSGAPTLEIRTPKAGGEMVRKFRYPN